jgi:hypothetical protein
MKILERFPIPVESYKVKMPDGREEFVYPFRSLCGSASP